MSEYYGQLIAGDNICIEKKNNAAVIHCTSFPSPLKNFNAGFFSIKTALDEQHDMCTVISNCIYRLNGEYKKLEDYVIRGFYKKYNYIYLDLAKNEIFHYHYTEQDENEREEKILTDSKYILLYKVTYQHQRVYAEAFAAGGLIDTVYGGEGFLYMLKNGNIKHTVTKISDRTYNEFYNNVDLIYMPSFDAVTREAVNINIPRSRRGILHIRQNDNYYVWSTTGYPGSSTPGETITVKINPEKIYF
ncbi:MAG: hypothetical protein IKA22_04150 [Lentisphaeria bacterium]|nr:hypothetical protein [Lentisphaeria bacterium]